MLSRLSQLETYSSLGIVTNFSRTLASITTTMDVLSRMKKPRLYVALYALNGALREEISSGPQDYYWAFIVAPKNASKEEECIRYRIKKRDEWEHLDPDKVDLNMVVWEVEKCMVPVGRHDDIVTRVLIGKIENSRAAEEHIQVAWPERTIHLKKTGRSRTSKDWVQRVLEGLGEPSPGSGGAKYMVSGKLADWATIESCCTSFAMKVVVESASLDTVRTFDILKNQEVCEWYEIHKIW